MTSSPSPEDPFVKNVRREVQRAKRAQHLTFWQGLSLTGTIGWMVSLPTVAGALAGRWLDHHFRSGVFWTLSLLTAGLALGCTSAWRHAKQELER